MRECFDLWAIKLANLVGERGTCNRGRSGSVMVRDKQILSVGYVGAPKGLPHCDDKCGHQIENNHCVRTVHSEINSIINAAKNGVALQGATLYTTMFPCRVCAMTIINAGIKRVVADYDYQKSDLSMELFDWVGITYSLIHAKVKKYEDKGCNK